MSKEEFVEMMTSFVFDVQQSVGFDTDASRALLTMLDATLTPLRSRCQNAQDSVAHLEQQISRQLAHRHGDIRTRFLRFDRQASGYMSYVDFQHALDVLNLDADPTVLSRLFQKYDPQGEGRINYTNFVHLVDATDADPPRSEAHDAMASHPPRAPPYDDDDLELIEHRRTEELVARIRAKLYQRGISVRQLFLQMDHGRYSYLTLNELHHGLTSILGVDLHLKELAYLTRHFTRKHDQFSVVDLGRLLDGAATVPAPTRAQRDGADAIQVAMTHHHPTTSRPSASPVPLGRTAPSCLDPSFEAKLAKVLDDQGKSRRALFESMAPLGSLTPAAFHTHLRRWGLHVADEADVVRLVGYFDLNGNGALEFHEFVRLCQRLDR